MYSAGKLASPQDFPTVIHRSDQLSTGQGVGVCSAGQQQAPPVVDSDAGGPGTPQQKIFAKVKLHCASDLRFYIL